MRHVKATGVLINISESRNPMTPPKQAPPIRNGNNVEVGGIFVGVMLKAMLNVVLNVILNVKLI